jgi:uncharacterized membrane protein YfcA
VAALGAVNIVLGRLVAWRLVSRRQDSARRSNVGGISTSPADAVLLLGAGVLAGAVGSAGGITSLISYPALLAVGIPALPANVTNAVALVASWPGSALGSRPELRGQGSWLRRLALLTAAGGAAGAALLLSTPAGVFGRVVPFLLVFASLALLLQPRVSAWQENHLVPGSRFMLPCGLLAVSAYGGYFGAGSGVMVLALLLLTVDRHLARANALKNMLLGVRTRPLDGARSTGRNRARGPTVDRPQLVGGPVQSSPLSPQGVRWKNSTCVRTPHSPGTKKTPSCSQSAVE